jgi:hypothetical protein
MWVDREGGGVWEWRWRRRLFVWEEALLASLLDVLPLVNFTAEEDDWRWICEDDGRFSVRSTYLLIDSVFSPEVLFDDHELRVFNSIWKSPAPSKVVAFVWKLLRNRIPTRVNLAHRGVLIDGGLAECVHCVRREETASHIFLFCDFAVCVWKAVFRWLVLGLIAM